MSTVYGTFRPAFPRLAAAVYHLSRAFFGTLFRARGAYRLDDAHAQRSLLALRAKLVEGETVHLMGIGPAGNNTGVALVEATLERGLRILSNDEEERYSGSKFETRYPEHSVEVLKRRLVALGLTPKDLYACLATFSYQDFLAFACQSTAESLPFSLPLILPEASHYSNFNHGWSVLSVPRRLGAQLGLKGPMPLIGMPHHGNHAYLAYGLSPFSDSDDPVMVSVLDAYGDHSSISLYLAKGNHLERVRANRSLFDSLGVLYTLISSTQGGWTPLSSEGRYMGAAAWGDMNRLTNPYYKQLRELVHFANDGQVFLNRKMTAWHEWGELRPYNRALEEVLGKAVPPEKMWNPDAVLDVDLIEHSPITVERVDKAAATQLLFEDGLFHIIGNFIRTTGSDKLVATGGCALNCVANMRLLEVFDETFYRRVFGKTTRLKLWVPPVPGDAGAPIGACFQFGMMAGARPKERLRHAFYCGESPGTEEIRNALTGTSEISFREIGSVNTQQGCERVADFAAYVIAHDGVLGIYQGSAETGPRALGHRSIVANPCNPKTLDNLNRLVKHRERVRPLAPMATLDAALKFFELSPGAAADDFNAYNYMVMTARAKPESHTLIPAVIHQDGTSRVQIVRKESDPFTYAYLKALGRRIGVEVSVNTSLNVASPIVQTPGQALEALRRSRGLTGLLLIGANGEAFLAWHDIVRPPKDAGKALLQNYEAWNSETLAVGAR